MNFNHYNNYNNLFYSVGGIINVIHNNGDTEEDNGDVNENWEVAAQYEEDDDMVSAGSSRGRSREANLIAQCLVCGGKAAAHQHYGAVCCYSCRAFFRRGISRAYSCVRGDMSCQVNSITRTNCKKCRFDRCLEVGMRPELVDATLRRKQEERRRQEIMDIHHDDMAGVGVHIVEDLESENQAVTGMMQLQQGGLVHREVEPHRSVIQAVQELQQPIPGHLLQQQQQHLVHGHKRRSDAGAAASGRKKVLLELRHNDVSPRHVSSSSTSRTIVTSQASSSSQPVRQQTYFIFHPMTQTFEPITIAEFEENAVVEEVVVGGDKTDENLGAVNEHDYIELSDDVNNDAHEVVVAEDALNNGEEILGNVSSPESLLVDKKPVIAPPVREINGRKKSSEAADLRIVRVESNTTFGGKTSVIKKLTNELIEETVKNNEGLKITKIKIPETEVSIEENSDGIFADSDNDVNIEDLVDVCFEEELVNNNEDADETKSRKRKVESGSLLPLKKRHQCKTVEIESFVSQVDLFSHRILEFYFTTEEEAKLSHICKMFQSSSLQDKAGTGLNVVASTSYFNTFQSNGLFPLSINQLEKFSNDCYFKEAALLLVKDAKVKSMFIMLWNSRKEDDKETVSRRNDSLLLYRYLTTLFCVSESSSVTHNLLGILEKSEEPQTQK